MSRKSVTFERNPLFGGPTLAERSRSGSPFRLLAISDIDVDPEQPRRVFNEESLAELASSIREYGVLCPILVRPTTGGTYRLIAGERRLRAAKIAGLDTIPAVIDSEEGESGEILGKQLVENLQREELSSMERALAIGHLRDRFGLSIRDISKKLGVSKGFVQRSIEVLALPDDLQAALIAGMSESKILLLSKVSDRDKRRELISRLEATTREELEELIRATEIESLADSDELYHGGTPEKQPKAISVEDQRIAQDIQNSLGSRVSISRSQQKPERGKLIVEFYSGDELSELYRRLT